MRTICIVLSASLLAAIGTALADTPETLVAQYTCPGGVPLWLWVSNESASCTSTSSGYACVNVLDDTATAGCSRGCETIEVGNLAGCFFGDGTPPVAYPNFTVSCSNGRTFDLTAREGDRCEQIDEGTQQNPKITGGKCYNKENPDDVGTSADCETGCGPTEPGADCKER